ncbi:MAG: TRAP transporter large permease [Rhodospirillaceae bacterium]|nr:TRAP transporter large permease [Rhodospirillaceae bacterium]
MSPALIGAVGLGVLLLLIALRIPIAIAMASVGIVGGALINGWSSLAFIVGSQPFATVFPYTLSVIPLFVMMGVFAAHAGLSRSLYEAIYSLIGHWRGGLALATIGACALFGAICGSSLATAATMARVAVPEMRRHGYDDRLSAGALAAGGTLGILIPPSIIMVIYALLTEQSIGQLFLAGFLPGIVATVCYMAAAYLVARNRPGAGPAGERVPWRQRLHTLKRVSPVLALFIVVMGGMYTGVFSPTEGAAVGSFGAFLLALASRRLTWRVFIDSLRETAGTTAMIFMIFIGTSILQYFIETSTLPRLLNDAIVGSGMPRYLVLVVILAIYIVLGCFLDSLSMLLITLPLFFPLVKALGFDPIWFGILVVCVVEIGLITPPVGMNLFVIASVVPNMALRTTMAGVLPFVAADVVRLAILVAIPPLSLWLPSLIK